MIKPGPARRDKCTVLSRMCLHLLTKVLCKYSMTACQQIVLIHIVHIKRRARHICPLDDILHRNSLVTLFFQQCQKRTPQKLTSLACASVLLFLIHITLHVFGQSAHFVHYRTFNTLCRLTLLMPIIILTHYTHIACQEKKCLTIFIPTPDLNSK